MRNSFTSIQKALRMSGNEDLNASAEKNVSRTDDQPLLVRTIAARPPRIRTEERTAIAWPRRALAFLALSRAARRSPVTL